ncbi:hypothetical protein CTheo_8879 [Ceratobasidium theobromae]|uniref:Uncharacterized protein n=1 Tax=Ceratobasidium theobromae TaxID=1582974 RepID=A0A5N5Q8C3_9AGAM|nr:hypothetical protein CTheo_8879 [Ceratobasidium theobromae]
MLPLIADKNPARRGLDACGVDGWISARRRLDMRRRRGEIHPATSLSQCQAPVPPSTSLLVGDSKGGIDDENLARQRLDGCGIGRWISARRHLGMRHRRTETHPATSLSQCQAPVPPSTSLLVGDSKGGIDDENLARQRLDVASAGGFLPVDV